MASELNIAVSVRSTLQVAASVTANLAASVRLLFENNVKAMEILNKNSDDADTLVSGQPTKRVYTDLPAGLTLADMLVLFDDTPLTPNIAAKVDATAEVQSYDDSTRTFTFKKALPSDMLVRIIYNNPI